MAGVNRKRETFCTWCGEPTYGDNVYVDLAKVVDGRWSRMTVHTACRREYVEVMQDNGYTIRPTPAYPMGLSHTLGEF